MSVHDRAYALPPQPLDVFTCVLTGVNQIEASAGTGKTWNICALYVRLLLERDLNADQILVVTFTKAATAELHERIRGRLAELARAIEIDDDGGDPFVAQLLDTTLGPDGLDRELAGKRIRRALSTFDQAAIHTIHAFCQRALQEAPFAAAMPFAFEMEADDASLRFELAAQFWRERIEPVAATYPAFAAWLVARGASPLELDAQLARRLKKPLAQLRWGTSGTTPPTLERERNDDARARFDAAGALWHAERESIERVLDDAQAALKQTTHKREAVRAALDAWGRYFAEGDCHAAPPREAAKLTATALAKATKVKFEPPEHPFFELADALASAAEAAEAGHRTRWLALLAMWLDGAPQALSAMKRTRRLASFDDLLSNLHGALTAHPWLADTLRARYPAALIDEFQDTDPLQFAIFERIFAGPGSDGEAGPLFLVGDPKQAIYSFRAADLHTYLAARHAATARYTLAVNQRSTAPLVAACNRIFGANPRAFVLDGLDYTPVAAAGRARAPLIDETDPARERDADGALRVWMLPSGEATLIKREAQRQAAEACGQEIVRLLRGAREGGVALGAQALAPADIAVLVRTHKQGSLMKRVLAAWGVGSVELAQSSVFATLDAEQLERVLAAVDAPGDLRRLRAALAADWFGLDAQALARLAQLADAPALAHADEATAWVERFSRYRSLWLDRGFATMWRTMMRELGIGERLIAGREGERRLTDVNHLAELAGARSAVHPGIAPTLRWLAAERARGGGEDAQLRLESDRDLVQIVTVHKSKGLEYAVVFCPFLGDGARMTGVGTGLPDASEYHEDAQAGARAVLHYGCEGADADRAEAEAAREEAAERARLVYVALTRAVHRCYLVAGAYLSSRSTKESRRSVLNWLVAGDGRPFETWADDPPADDAIEAAWAGLADDTIARAPLPSPARRVPLAREAALGSKLAARTMGRTLTETWRIASFSSLAAAGARHASVTVDDEPRPDHDALAAARQEAAAAADPVWLPEPTLPVPAPTPEALLAADDILAFPRGAAAGECLHRMFELADFSDPSTWPGAIADALVERPVATDADTAARLPAMMAHLIADVTATEVAPGMTLAALDPTRRLTEWPFLFASPSLELPALRGLLARHGYADVALEAGTLSGYVKGFIDMVVEHEGRFWIIDWKSNHLGTSPAEYGAAALEAAMAHHAYHLQALLYLVAVHRYLKARRPSYDYDAHIGGYSYLFVRGVRPSWRDGAVPAGVHARRPARELIEALDALMSGERTS
ncbi:exodeoxyribonuclease V subunit beta [Trinickia dinghuensis]|uniref:RecBCD enzyme subunit RecB n=1 Tax=Trinickia dinghuensis TaxID=2291023 RepID=A0A3D8JVU8_9BURK|nr:exodeoxyribonuclease V subunit beta [Trinickia dinghuensis]RDU96980.1 exodeoxyribonuclease V subunit beta [Trinickia dinghuensis]